MIDVNKLKSVIKKALSFNSKPTEDSFPELPTVLIWLRFLLAISNGTYLGMNGAMGGAVMLHTLNLIAFIPVMYCRLYLGTGMNEYGSKVIFSGLLPAIALSTLLWIYLFTALHAEAEGKLASMLISTVVQQLPVDGSSGGSDGATHETSPVKDSEF